MKRNTRIIQINGFRGLVLTFFIICCLAAGFIIFPAFLTMNVWNYFATKVGSLTYLNFGEGTLLWCIVAFSAFIFNKKKFIVSFNNSHELTEDEIKDVLAKIKTQAINSSIALPENFKIETENKDEIEAKSEQTKL